MEQARFWWSGRSTRERAMLAVMGALLAIVLLVVAVILPVNAARLSAEQRLEAATIDAGRVATVADRLRTARATAAPPLSTTLPVALGTAAEANGFTLSRLDAQGADRVTIGIPSVRSTALFAWLATLERQGIIVDRLTLRTNSDTSLSVEGVARVRGR